MSTKDLYLLDVSGFLFRAYFALPPMANRQGQATHALFGFIRSVIKLFKECAPENIVAVFDGPDNKKTRRALYGEYKANRVSSYEDLPEQLALAKEFCQLVGLSDIEVEGVEADDTMGSIALWASQRGWRVFLCTSDKDFCQLVGEQIFVLNPWKENLVIDRNKVEELYGVPPEQIVDLLAIVGDASDNIPGLSGFGPKTTIPLLKEFGSLENLLKNSDKVKGAAKQKTLQEGVETALLCKKLATIATDVPFPKEESFFHKKTPDPRHLRDFYLECDFGSLVKELDLLVPTEKEEGPLLYHTIDEESALTTLLERLSQEKEICFDIESTSLNTALAQAVGVGLGSKKGEAFYIPMHGRLGKKRAIALLKPFFENPKLSFFGHNAKYDIHVLLNEGIGAPRLSFDTILASYLLNASGRKHSLDALSLHYFGKVKTPIKELIGRGKKEISMEEVAIEKVSAYCCEDVDYTVRLKEVLEQELLERHLMPLLKELELPLSSVLLKMERKGIFVSAEKLFSLSKEISSKIASLEKEIYTMAGEEFNLNSPKQLATILFEKMGIKGVKKTATGQSTRAEVLETLAGAGYPIALKLLEWRTLDKLRSTYIDPLPGTIDPRSGRIHTTFIQYVATTGRLACQDPNLQNIPVRSEEGKKIREAFRPEKKGWSYLAADYSQIELRLLAHLSEDPSLIKAFWEGEDIHRFTASLVLDIPYEKVSKKERDQAKVINFGIIYGQQAYGLSRELGIEIKEAQAFIQAYFERYPKVLSFTQECIEKARKTRKAVTMCGRERQLPDLLNSNVMIRQAAERLAVNTPLQGSAADLIKRAMLQIDALVEKKGLKSFLILQIHDELIFEAPDEELPILSPLVVEAMQGVFPLKVPLVVDVTVGKNWGEC